MELGQTGFFSLGTTTTSGEGKLGIQTRFTQLKKLTWYHILSMATSLGKEKLWIQTRFILLKN